MLDMKRITQREKVTKKRGVSERIDAMRLARIEEYQTLLAPLFSDIEDVEMTISDRHILVKHDGVFDLVELGAGSAHCLDRECLAEMPELKDWWDRYFD